MFCARTFLQTNCARGKKAGKEEEVGQNLAGDGWIWVERGSIGRWLDKG